MLDRCQTSCQNQMLCLKIGYFNIILSKMLIVFSVYQQINSFANCLKTNGPSNQFKMSWIHILSSC